MPTQAVDAMWTMDVSLAASGAWRHRVLPDGCMDLILKFYRREGGLAYGCELLVAGPSASSDLIDLFAGDGFVGVRFAPGWGGRCLRVDAPVLAGQVVRAAELHPTLRSLADRLEVAAPISTLKASFQEAVLGLAESGGNGNRAQSATAQLRASQGRADLRRLAAAFGISPRTLRREVTAEVGLPPKALARVFRFQHALRHRASAPADGLAAAATTSGYADQAHMTREFRALGGFTPARQAEMLGRNVQDHPGETG